MFKFILASLFMLQVFSTTTNYTLIMSTDGSGNPAWLFTEGASGFNPTLFANVGDVLIFNVSGTNSPFAIHTAPDTAGTSFSQYSGLSPVVLQATNGIATLTVGNDTNGILYYVSENSASAVGEIIINYNCSAIPSIFGGSAGSCIANSPNGTSCIPTCNSGYTGSLSAMCINGTWVFSGSCSSTSGSGSNNNNNNTIEYIFTITGRTSNNCTYVSETVLPQLNTWGQNQVATNGASFNAQLVSCGSGSTTINLLNNNNNGGSSFTIDVTIVGVNADSVIIDESNFENTLQNQIQLDNSVTVVNIDVQRNSGLVMQASLLALLSIIFVALTH